MNDANYYDYIQKSMNAIIYKSKLINQTFTLDCETDFTNFQNSMILSNFNKDVICSNIFFDYCIGFNCFANFPNYLTQATFMTYCTSNDIKTMKLEKDFSSNELNAFELIRRFRTNVQSYDDFIDWYGDGLKFLTHMKCRNKKSIANN